jgi:hypothetical protein
MEAAAHRFTLIDYCRGRWLGKGEWLILETLTQAFPDALTKEDLAAKVGYDDSASLWPGFRRFPQSRTFSMTTPSRGARARGPSAVSNCAS